MPFFVHPIQLILLTAVEKCDAWRRECAVLGRSLHPKGDTKLASSIVPMSAQTNRPLVQLQLTTLAVI